MGPATSREQIGEQIGDDDGLQIHTNPTIVANNIVSAPFPLTPLLSNALILLEATNVSFDCDFFRGCR